MFGPGASVNNARKNWRAFLLWPGPRSRQRRGLSLSLAASQPVGASNIRPVPKPPRVGVAGLCQSCDRTYAWPPALEQGERSGVGFVGAPQLGAFFLEFHGDIAMKKLIAATAAVLALGIATSEVAHAQTPRSTTAPPPQSTQSETAVPESQVKQAQQQLKSAGLYKGTVDGKMGTDTQQAIEQFQQQHGLVATGTLDEQTMAALQGSTGRAGSSASPLTPSGQPSSTGR